MRKPGADIMNTMTRSILNLAAYDEQAMDTSVPNSLRQCIQLISQFPVLAVYGYNAYNYYVNESSMIIHNPEPALSTAENILRMLRPDKQYTQVEAKVLDTALLLHMEHGGGNNSTFTTRVVTSSGSDTRKQIEIDFVANKGSQRYYIQSAFALPSLEKVAQEERPLKNVPDSFKKIIVVKDNIMLRRDDNGITTMGLKQFLLDPHSLEL